MNRNTTQIAAAEASEASLGQEWLRLLRYRLGDRRILIGVAAALFTAALAFNWQWLVAAGLASLIVGVLPCIAMCALGMCAMGRGNSACGKNEAGKEANQPSSVRHLPASKRASEPDEV